MPLPKYVQEAFDSQNKEFPEKENLFTKENVFTKNDIFGESISCLGDGVPKENIFLAENGLPNYVTDAIEKRKQSDTDSQEWGTEWMRENPFLAGLYGAGKGLLEQAIAPSIEAVGMIAGSVGSPIVGTALGYGIAKQLNDILIDSYKRLGGEEIENSSISDEMLQSAADVGTVLILGKAMDTGAKIAPVVEDYLFNKLPKRLYANAIKTPMSKKWIQTLPNEIVSKQTAAIEEGLRSKILPSKYGLSKIKGLEKEVSGYIDDVTKILSKDPSKVISRETILKTGLKDAYTKASHSSDPKGAKLIVDAIAERFKAHPSTLTPVKANQIKRQLYKELKFGLSEPSALKAQMDSIGKKGVAREIMLNLEQIYPALAELNATDAARISLTEIIEKAYAREAQRNMLPLGAKVLMRPKVWPLSIWEATVGHPQVKARLAFALHKANPVKYPAKPSTYTPPVKPPKSGVKTNLPGEKILYHTTSKALKGNKPDFDAFYGNKKWTDTYIKDPEMKKIFDFGEHTYAIKIPSNAKILDLQSRTKDADSLIKTVMQKNSPYNKQSVKELLIIKGGTSRFYENWAENKSLLETTRKMGYEGLKFGDEYLLTKELSKRAKTSKPVFKSPTGLTSAREGTYTAKQLDKMLKSKDPIQVDTALMGIMDERLAAHKARGKDVTMVNKMLKNLKNEKGSISLTGKKKTN